MKIDLTGDPSLSPYATILVICSMACLAIEVGIKLLIVLLIKWRSVSANIAKLSSSWQLQYAIELS